MSSSELFQKLHGKFTQDEIRRLVQFFGSQHEVGDNFKTNGPEFLRELLSSGQGQKKGQGGGGMQTQQQQQTFAV